MRVRHFTLPPALMNSSVSVSTGLVAALAERVHGRRAARVHHHLSVHHQRVAREPQRLVAFDRDQVVEVRRELCAPVHGEGRGLVQRAPIAQWREARVEVVEALVGQLEPHQFGTERLLEVVERAEFGAIAVAGEDAVPGG